MVGPEPAQAVKSIATSAIPMNLAISVYPWFEVAADARLNYESQLTIPLSSFLQSGHWPFCHDPSLRGRKDDDHLTCSVELWSDANQCRVSVAHVEALRRIKSPRAPSRLKCGPRACRTGEQACAMCRRSSVSARSLKRRPPEGAAWPADQHLSGGFRLLWTQTRIGGQCRSARDR